MIRSQVLYPVELRGLTLIRLNEARFPGKQVKSLLLAQF